MSLRARFLLTVVVASVIPLALVGLWLTDSARRSGDVLLQARLNAALDETVRLVASQYVRQRSALLFVAEDGDVQALLAEASSALSENGESGAHVTSHAGLAVEDLESRFPGIDPAIHAIDIADRSGHDVARLERAPSGGLTGGSTRDQALVRLELAVYERITGSRLGTLRIALEPELLLPPSRLPPTAAGTIITLAGPSGYALTPVPIQLPEAGADRFEWAGEEWTMVRRELTEPAVTVVAAATLGPALEPFRRAALRGTVILVVVSLLALASTAYLTQRLTRSLDRLSEAAAAVAGGDLARTIPVEADDEIGRVAEAFNRMTERLRRTLDRMAGKESLAAVGEFAAGLAHEVRNPLTAVQINLQFVESELPEDSPLHVAQRKALAEIRRLDSTVRDALRVARSSKIDTRSIDLREPLEAAVDAARPTFAARGATLRMELPPESVQIDGDPGALEQLFLNLLQNAGQALEDGGEAVASIQLDRSDVLVRIRDDGPGMPPGVRERVFEPLFSTRAEGTGLGLPIAQRIALAHEGALRVETEPGAGTTVELRVPLAAPSSTHGDGRRRSPGP